MQGLGCGGSRLATRFHPSLLPLLSIEREREEEEEEEDHRRLDYDDDKEVEEAISTTGAAISYPISPLSLIHQRSRSSGGDSLAWIKP